MYHTQFIYSILFSQNVLINDDLKSLVSVNEELAMSETDQWQQPSLGCRSHDLCGDHMTCQNGGQCTDLWFTAECECPAGFIGKVTWMLM